MPLELHVGRDRFGHANVTMGKRGAARSGGRLARSKGTAHVAVPLEHQGPAAGTRQIERAHERVVPAAPG